MACAVLSRSHAVVLFEITHEVAFVCDADPAHYLFPAQERALQKSPGLFQSERLLALHHGHSGLDFEQVTQVRGREVDGACYLAGSKSSAQVRFDQAQGLLHSLIHSLRSCGLKPCR
jgi:hypothetical protein